MESVNLDMDDIFESGEGNDEEVEDFGTHAGLPDLDLEDNLRARDDQPNENNEDDEVLANLNKLSKGAAKKKVQRPQPKLNAERLKSDRGLPALAKLFKDTQFQGKGHEKSDLKTLMYKLEHWAHRLFPKIPFDEFIERMEKLGGKKEIQTCIKRIRLDMPILNDDFVSQQDDDDDQLKKSVDEQAAPDLSDSDEGADVEATSDWMTQSRNEGQDLISLGSRGNLSLNIERQVLPPSTPRSPMVNSPMVSSPMPSTPSQSLSSSIPISVQNTSSLSLTAEQQRRIEANRLLALQKRAQRLTNAASTLGGASQNDSSVGTEKSQSNELGNRDTENSSLISAEQHAPETVIMTELPQVSMQTENEILDSLNMSDDNLENLSPAF